ncbi:MAG: hypothetical protein SWX82_14945 [Cyanobacteriota bacterium]|nr:hypothetical protein [Cyanobacteriota bacterium]
MEFFGICGRRRSLFYLNAVGWVKRERNPTKTYVAWVDVILIEQ